MGKGPGLYSDIGKKARESKMAATTTSTFSVGSNLPHGSKMSPLLQSKAPGAYCNFNKLRSFSGLKVATTSSCESELAFFGRDSRAALQTSFPCKTQNQRQEYTASNQIKASFKVDVLGAAGGIGQPLALLIKMSPLVSTLHLYDVANVKGVAADLSHCNTPSQVLDFTGTPELASAFKGVDVVVIPAGVPRKPGMTRDELFNINANIVKTLVLT